MKKNKIDSSVNYSANGGTTSAVHSLFSQSTLSIDMADILVTGSNGFIGSNLCQKLNQQGYSVRGVDVKEPEYDVPNSVEITIGDLLADTKLPNADVIVHLAAHSQVQPVVENPSLINENIRMTQHVLEEARRMDAAVINISSRDVYGTSIRPTESEVTPNSPNGYAASKLGSEAIVNAYRHSYDISAVSLRLSNVYGPMDTNCRVIPIFIATAAAGEELTVFGEEKIVDFIHISDVNEAILSTIQRLDALNGESINIGSGLGTPLSEAAEYITRHVESCPGWSTSTNRSGDVSRYVSNISKAESLLDFGPGISFKQGLSDTIKWYTKRPEVLKSIRMKLDSN